MKCLGDTVRYFDADGVERAALVIGIRVDADGRRQLDHALDLAVFSPVYASGNVAVPLFFGSVPWADARAQQPHSYHYGAAYNPPMPLEVSPA